MKSFGLGLLTRLELMWVSWSLGRGPVGWGGQGRAGLPVPPTLTGGLLLPRAQEELLGKQDSRDGQKISLDTC